MAFIREYAAMSGDPFSLRRPKWAKRIKGGRVLRSALGAAAGLVPGVGQALDFARGYGLIQGDPKRKHAGSGPKSKAGKKAQHRADKHSGVHVPAHDKRRGKGHAIHPAISKGIGGLLGGIGTAAGSIDWGQVAAKTAGGVPIVGGGLEDILEQGQAAGARGVTPIATPVGMLHPAHARALGFGHRRRQINPTNVKALKRGLRRVEGFQKLVKSVERAFPMMKRAHGHTASKGHRGHKRGCKCIACR